MAQPHSTSTHHSRLGLADIAGMTAGFALCLLVSYVFGRGRILWEDEMLGWMLLHDPSWRHMLGAWKLGADGGGISFYLLGRAWFKLFGASALAFRWFSASCFGAAFCVVWAAARRFYHAETVAVAMFTLWFASPPIAVHLAEGRFYGLLVLSTALVVAVTMRLARRNSTGRSFAHCAALFLTHGLLVTSHLLGVVYSVVLLAALMLLDVFAGRRRPALYASAAASWLLLVLERQAIRASVAVGRPHFWTLPANLQRLVGAYTAYSGFIALVLLILGTLLAAQWLRHGAEMRSRVRAAVTERRAVYTLGAVLLLVPLVLAVESHVATSLFINRYLMPVAIGEALLVMELLRLTGPLPMKRATRPAAAVVYAAALLAWVFVHEPKTLVQKHDYTDALTARLPHGVPVVCEDAWQFTELMGRQHDSGVDYTFLLDWPWAVSAQAPRLEAAEFHLMENWRKAGYFAGSIVDRDAFLQAHPQFLVLRPPVRGREPDGTVSIGNFLVDRFRQTPGYEVKELSAAVGEQPQVWQVCRGRCSR